MTRRQRFEAFEAAHREWVRRLGLTDWNVVYECVPLDGKYAITSYNRATRTATVSLDTKRWVFPKRMRKLAAHEAAHLLLADLYILARERHSTLQELDVAEEQAVVRLENLLGELGS